MSLEPSEGPVHEPSENGASEAASGPRGVAMSRRVASWLTSLAAGSCVVYVALCFMLYSHGTVSKVGYVEGRLTSVEIVHRSAFIAKVLALDGPIYRALLVLSIILVLASTAANLATGRLEVLFVVPLGFVLWIGWNAAFARTFMHDWVLDETMAGPDGRTYCLLVNHTSLPDLNYALAIPRDNSMRAGTYEVLEWNTSDNYDDASILIRPSDLGAAQDRDMGRLTTKGAYLVSYRERWILLVNGARCYVAYDLKEKTAYGCYPRVCNSISPFVLLDSSAAVYQSDLNALRANLQWRFSIRGRSLNKGQIEGDARFVETLRAEMKNPNPAVRRLAAEFLDLATTSTAKTRAQNP
jgi:hypothetical protein